MVVVVIEDDGSDRFDGFVIVVVVVIEDNEVAQFNVIVVVREDT